VFRFSVSSGSGKKWLRSVCVLISRVMASTSLGHFKSDRDGRNLGR